MTRKWGRPVQLQCRAILGLHLTHLERCAFLSIFVQVLDDGPGVGGSDEHPVFLADGGGADGVFDEVVVDLYSPVLGKGAELRPLVEGVGDGFAEGALGEVFGAEFVQGSVEPLEDGLALELAGKFS